MQISGSAQSLPPFSKNSPIFSSIAPFKSSLKKNPGYFSVVRSPEVLQEKKKLKEENWKLKQLMHTINEENLKLKQKLSQKTEISRLAMSEGTQMMSQSRYIDVLQDSLRTLRSELNKKKQENLELRKKLFVSKDEKLDEIKKIISTRGSFHLEKADNEGVMGNKDSQGKNMAELNNNLSYLNSEIKILKEENLILEEKCEKYKEILKEKEAGRQQKLQVVLLENLSANFNETVKIEKNSSFIEDRMLKREDLKNDQANLFRFFRNFFSELDKANLDLTLILEYIKVSIEENPQKLFQEMLKRFNLKLPFNELTDSFKTLNRPSLLTKPDFIELLLKYSKDFDSSQSSDISSGRFSKDSLKPSNITRNSITLDNIALILQASGISKEEILKILSEHLPVQLTLKDLTEFIFNYCSFIQNVSDKTFLAVYLMEGFESKPRHEVVRKMIEMLFENKLVEEADIGLIEGVLRRIKDREIEIMRKLRELDSINSKVLDWGIILEVLRRFEAIKDQEVSGFKVHCFYLGKDLKKIPYESLMKSQHEILDGGKIAKSFNKQRTIIKKHV